MTDYKDPFEDIPGGPPEGWSYQWVATSIVGNEEIAEWYKKQMERDGWHPVPANHHPDMPASDGKIQMGGCVLMERPVALTKAAQAEEERKALRMLPEWAKNTGKIEMPKGFVFFGGEARDSHGHYIVTPSAHSDDENG